MVASFEILIILISIGLLALFSQNDRQFWKKFIIVFIGVLVFEFLTQALWVYQNLESWAFVYLNFSWVVALGWTSIILVSVTIVDYTSSRRTERITFLLHIIIASVFGLFAEIITRALSVREYASSVTQFIDGENILGIVPIEAFFYLPVFMAFVIAFEKYWSRVISFSHRGGMV